MMATILPPAIILTKADRAMVIIMAKGCTVSGVLPMRCFLILLPNYTNILVCSFYFPYLVKILKYPFLNTPKQQYFMLLTSVG